MSTRNCFSSIVRLVVAGAIVGSVGCGGELLRTGRAPVYLVVTGVQAQPQGGETSNFLQSDVRSGQGVAFNDNVIVTITVQSKNPAVEATAINAVTLTRYHVEFRRTDGRNRPGVDVPFGFDGALSTTVTSGSSGDVTFELVRHQAKFEAPLTHLAGFGDVGFLSTIADITIYGRDQNGNQVQVSAAIDVHFADFADEEDDEEEGQS
jgi:hypothetical protein